MIFQTQQYDVNIGLKSEPLKTLQTQLYYKILSKKKLYYKNYFTL